MDTENNNIVNLKKEIPEREKIRYTFKRNKNSYRKPKPIYVSIDRQELRFSRVLLAFLSYITWSAWIPSILIDDNKFNKKHVNCAVTIRLIFMLMKLATNLNWVGKITLLKVKNDIIYTLLSAATMTCTLTITTIYVVLFITVLFNLMLAIIGSKPAMPLIKYLNIFK